jgi:5'-deoxynucleotidase YfbR-like HD superfamily hydrolase
MKLTKNCFVTSSNTAVNPVDPTVDMINLEDISIALSNSCRWGGHTPEPYTIAQHSVMVMATLEIVLGKRCTNELRRQALLHDASEAYMGDLVAPLKRQMPEYRKVEDGLQKVIAIKFGLNYPWDPMICAADKASMVALEAPICGKPADGFEYFFETEPYKSWINVLQTRVLPMTTDKVWPHKVARSVFMECAEHLNLQ